MSEEQQTKDITAVEGVDDLQEKSVDGAEDLDNSAEQGLWPLDRLSPLVEALLFAAADPLAANKIVEFVEGSTIEEVKTALADLSTELLTRGIRLIEVAGGWQLRTAPEHQRYVRKLFRERPQRLTRAATETVAIVAYRQPVTRSEIETVRGVDCGGVLESLVERRLVKVMGRKDVPGRPLVYATTKEFLELFGLRSLRDMPTLPELGSDFERMSDQGGFTESEKARILPLEDDDGTQSGGPDQELQDTQDYGRQEGEQRGQGSAEDQSLGEQAIVAAQHGDQAVAAAQHGDQGDDPES